MAANVVWGEDREKYEVVATGRSCGVLLAIKG
jgi:hypothetical protein